LPDDRAPISVAPAELTSGSLAPIGRSIVSPRDRRCQPTSAYAPLLGLCNPRRTRDTVAVDPSKDPDVTRLLQEQAALRRVATLVARGTDRLGVFAAVAEEVGRLVGADVTSMIRFEDDHGTVVGGWSGGPAPSAPIGYRISMERDSTAARVRSTGRAARVEVGDQPGDVFAVLRELGVRASVGAPVVVDGKLWGAVMVGSTVEAAFAPDVEERLAGFAELVAQALANAEAGKSSPLRASGSWRPPGSNGAGSNATSTTVPNSAWSVWH
jgi:hypothetical protein